MNKSVLIAPVLIATAFALGILAICMDRAERSTRASDLAQAEAVSDRIREIEYVNKRRYANLFMRLYDLRVCVLRAKTLDAAKQCADR